MERSELEEKLVDALWERAVSGQFIQEVLPLSSGGWRGYATFMREVGPVRWETVEVYGAASENDVYQRLLAGICAISPKSGE